MYIWVVRAGMGIAAGTVAGSDLSRLTTKKQRTLIYTMLVGMMQFGYTIGEFLPSYACKHIQDNCQKVYYPLHLSYGLLISCQVICVTYIGPGLNIALGCLDFQLGPFKVDKYSAPGVSYFRIVIN